MTDEALYVAIHDLSPDDVPYGDEWDGPTNDAATSLANDIHRLVTEEYPFDTPGVEVVVNEDAHERLNDAQ